MREIASGDIGDVKWKVETNEPFLNRSREHKLADAGRYAAGVLVGVLETMDESGEITIGIVTEPPQ